MSSHFNNNELIIISKYIESNDYNTFFKIFPNINTYYHSTFNYININVYDINYTLKYLNKFKNNILKTFPNINTIIINLKMYYNKYYDYKLLILIIKLYNTFLNSYPDKFIKLNIINLKMLMYYKYYNFKNIYINYFNKIDELIKTKHLNNDFKFYINYIGIDIDKDILKYDFIINIDRTNFLNLNINDTTRFLNNSHIVYTNITTKDDLKNLYIHRYNNAIFKKLNNNIYCYCVNKLKYDYLYWIKYFPTYYKLIKLGIKLKYNYKPNYYVMKYIKKLNLNNNKKDFIHIYLFGYYPLKEDVTKVIYDIIYNKSKNNRTICNYYDVIKTLNDIFKTY